MSSGEHRLGLDRATTEPCPPDPDSPEADRDTWPRFPAAPRVPRFDLKTDVLEDSDS